MYIEWERLKNTLISNFVLDETSLHGLTHWETVEDFGLRIAKQNGANIEIVRLFSFFHDACRQTDEHELTHGAKGAEYARMLRGDYFDLPDSDFERLVYACKWHTHGKLSDDPTVGACWDADRLDLGRVGVVPKVFLLSNQVAHQMVEKGEHTM